MSPSTVSSRTLGAGAGIMLDRLFGEPKASVHPVVHFGNLMKRFEDRWYADKRACGVVHTLVGSAVGVGAGTLLRWTPVATGLSVGAHALHDAAREVGDALRGGDLDEARSLLPSLVGRDPSDLDASEIARAAVESVAENTVDAIVAPALWAALAGAPGALGYRSVNTMDAMVGHRSQRYANYGWASARLDDALNWVPARCTAALVALVRPHSSREIRHAITTQAPAHPSPNSGVAEAAFAAVLGIQIGGRSRYGERFEDRPLLGHGRRAQPRDIDQSILLSRQVATALATLLGIAGVTSWWLRP